jgi:hypothetical protein
MYRAESAASIFFLDTNCSQSRPPWSSSFARSNCLAERCADIRNSAKARPLTAESEPIRTLPSRRTSFQSSILQRVLPEVIA